jgi:hypothetical protein
MANELICSVCEQGIELKGKNWVHSWTFDVQMTRDLGCWDMAKPKAPEPICSVCGQMIEENRGGIGEFGYDHVPGQNVEITRRMGCWGKAVPKAPEPTGDDKVTCKCPIFCGCGHHEPKAPDVTER